MLAFLRYCGYNIEEIRRNTAIFAEKRCKMIRRKGNVYKLDTPNTTMLIRVGEETGYVYYGKRLSVAGFDYATAFDQNYGLYKPTRASSFGTDDGLKLLSSFGEISQLGGSVDVAFSDGSFTARFAFVRAKFCEKPDLSPLPSSYSASKEKNACQTLCLEFLDEPTKLRLFLYYTVFDDSDVITVSSKLYNGGSREVRVKNLASLQLDVYGDGYSFVNFVGNWANERNKTETPVNVGCVVQNESRNGFSSHHNNPFVMLKKEGTVYAFNLVYSGNYKETATCSDYPKTRVVIGINNFALDKKLPAGQSFSSPEAVVCFAENEDGATRAMHSFVNEHIVRGKWKGKERPILINNWEATYFNFNREKLLAIADEAASLGVETFVLDDGWFGRRDTDNCSLGDWFDYAEKTGGIAKLAEDIRVRGLKFGIWVEPEMISEDSELYRKHPEFTMKIPSREPMRLRQQLILNLADPKVQKYLIRVISNVITETKASYVKWDCNRRMTDCYAKDVPYGEYFLQYMEGLYTVIGKLVERFPSVLFEGCSGGGGRFDLGMLCYMPQIWTSDDTDARQRTKIQCGTSYGYPQSAISCHVSASPNHQTGNETSLETRFNIAALGAFGYEMDITKCTEAEKEQIKAQIAFFKKYRKVLQFGDFYRLGDPFNKEISGVICVQPNKALAVASVCVDKRFGRESYLVQMKGLDPAATYEVTAREQFGYDKKIKFYATGEMLLYAGIPLNGIFDDCSKERSANALYSRAFVIKKTEKKAKA